VSPTVFREDEYRFYFFSREESRMHVHIYIVAMAKQSFGLNLR